MSDAYTPYGFAEEVLGLKLYPWQRDVLHALMPIGARVSLRAANESGKTGYVAAPFVLWHLALFPGSQVVCTSGVWRQVTEQLWRVFKKFGPKFGWKVTQDTVETPQGSKAIGFSTTEGGKFEGFHADDPYESPLAIVVDEAKTVSDEVFQGMERCRPTRWLIQSSPGAPMGGFFEYDNDPRFKHYKVTAFECPHLGQKQADDLAIKHGRESMLYASMIMAEWMNDPTQTCVCSRRAVDKCLSTPIHRSAGRPIGGIDIAHAESGNENVFVVRNGNVIEIDAAFKGGGNANVIVDRMIQRFMIRKMKPHEIWIDADGMGAIYADMFAAKGWNINLWRGQAKAFDSQTYYSRSAEAYFSLARAIEQCNIILPPDETFIKQFTTRGYHINNKGQIQLNPKEDAFSPDRADAIVIAWSIVSSQDIRAMQYDPFDNERFDKEDDPNVKNWQRILPPGCNVGI
jgi:phage terminase large subunit